jgi:vacuolar-type H+-ATPase subunit H
MSTTDPRPGDLDVDAALARVLQAEQAARGAIDAARAEAARMAEQARTHARRYAERARARMARGQAAVERDLQAQLAAIAEQARALPERDEPDPLALGRLERAVQALAAELTGGHPRT